MLLKLVKGLDTIMAGEFGINCKQIIFPVKSSSSTITVETIEKGAFSKNGIKLLTIAKTSGIVLAVD